jgi:hypothetical protein
MTYAGAHSRCIGGLVALALVVACGPNLAQEPAAEFQARVAHAISAGDTAQLAVLAEQRCASLATDPRRDCYEDFFLTLADSGRVRLALGALDRLGNARREVIADGHSLTHVIGIRAWKPGDDVAQVFRSCNELYQSGCYHGVIQAYLTAGEADSVRTTELCNQIAPMGTDNWLRFQCVHGLGHGLEMARNWNLPEALAGCDWLNGSWDRDSCYGGAFMENSVASVPGGHHTSVRALAASSDHEHQHGPAEPPTWKMRDSTDALYPCTVVGDAYQRACYVSQGSILLEHVNYDFELAARECDRVPEVVRSGCYTSLGTNASGVAIRDTEKAISLCAKGNREWQSWCYVGVVKNFIDVTANPDDGIRFCQAVSGNLNRERCWRAVGEQLSVLYTQDLARRGTVCAKAGDGEAECRRGAGV